MLMLPSEVQNKIYQDLIDILRQEIYSYKHRVFLNWRKQELYYQHSDDWLYMLLESHDIEEYGFTSANVSNAGVTGTLEVVLFNVKVRMRYIEMKQNRNFIKHNIMKCLSKRIAKVHDHTVANQCKVEILNVCNSRLVTQTIARDHLVYSLMKITNETCVFLPEYMHFFCCLSDIISVLISYIS